MFKAFILGIIEGLTEYLPISSTGHLIVFGELMNFHSTGKVFEIAIQLGAVMAVVVEYRQRFKQVITGIGRDAQVNRFVFNIAIAIVPAAVMGLIFRKEIKELLFNPLSVATALIIGGLIILWIEKRPNRPEPRVQSVDDMKPIDALMVGVAQIFALIPGTSRSGSTIMGGMMWGLERKTATEFSFFLAVPMMVMATVYDIYKSFHLFTLSDIGLIAIGFVSAFVSGLLAIRTLLKFLASKNYVPFAYYRIVFGGVILLTAWTGLVKWN